MIFRILAKDKKTKARSGILSTKSGKIETPFFMPVATKAGTKHISSFELVDLGAKAIISNAYVLSLKPGTEVVKKFGGIGKFMKYPGIVFTDSGGFQMYSPALFISSKKEGVMFRDPFSGEKKFITPEMDMKIQLDLNSDVAMCLDSMPLMSHSKEKVEEAINKTYDWAIRCKSHHDKLQKSRKKGKKQLLFGIIQGGIHSDLRELSAKQLTKINFDGFSIGGLALGEPKEDEYRMIKVAKKIIPETKPVYLMGAGEPRELLEAISLGVDIFDSRFPTQNARRGTIFTWNGRLKIFNKRYTLDSSPLDKKCSCFTCKNYSKGYIKHMLWHQEGLGYRLVTIHNLFFMQELMKKSREAIKKGKFNQFKKNFIKNYKN